MICEKFSMVQTAVIVHLLKRLEIFFDKLTFISRGLAYLRLNRLDEALADFNHILRSQQLKLESIMESELER